MSVSVICFTRQCGSNSDKTVILQIEGKVWIWTDREVCSYISQESNGKVFKAHVACICCVSDEWNLPNGTIQCVMFIRICQNHGQPDLPWRVLYREPSKFLLLRTSNHYYWSTVSDKPVNVA